MQSHGQPIGTGLVLLALIACSATSHADYVVYHDLFSRQGALTGSTPDQGNAPWTADAAWQINGSNAQVTAYGKLAFLPFQPHTNNVYTLSATVNCTNANPVNEWMALGFANGSGTSGAWHTVNHPVGWMLLRYQSDTNNQAQAFLGPGAANGGNVGVYSGPHTLSVVLDTRPASATNWTFQFSVDGNPVFGPLPFDAGGPQISTVGMGNENGVGRVDDFSLTSLNDDSIYWAFDVATGIRCITTPMRGSTNLVLPDVAAGYQLAIKTSSNPAVISTNAVIYPPATNTVVTLVLTVTCLANGGTADTGTIQLFVPAGQARAPFVNYSDNYALRYGLNITWTGAPDGLGNPILFSDGTRAYSMDQFADSVNVEAVADQVAGFGFEYVILTEFHGYQTTLHPCAALDDWRGPGYTAKRDMVGELIAALKARGIKVFLFTHPLDGYDGYTAAQQALVGWNDPTGGYKRWNDFINDVYAELVEHYGDDIAGIQFDSEFGMSGDLLTYQKLDLLRLRQTILSRRPQLTLTALAGPNDTAEFGEKEVWRPSWLDPWGSLSESNYDVEVWPAYLRVPAVVEGYHWGTIEPPAEGLARLNGDQMFRYTVLQAGVSTEGTGIAWAASPYTDGTWEANLGPALTNLSLHVQAVAESIKNTLPGTSYPTDEGASLSTLPYGIVATQSRDGTVEYIHVLNPPAGNTLTLPLPADGRTFLSASLLANQHPVLLSTNIEGVTLALTNSDTWNALDTVIKLRVNPGSIPPFNFALHNSVSASSAVEYGSSWGSTTPWGRIRLVDGQLGAVVPGNGWSAGNNGFSTKPIATNRAEWVSVDLETTNLVNEVRLYPRMDAGNVGYGYPVNFDLCTSVDGLAWTVAVALTNQPQPAGVQVFPFPARPARYVRLNTTQLRANPNDSGQFALQLAELEVFGPASIALISIQSGTNTVVLQWANGVLQVAGSPNGPFTDVPGAGTPFVTNVNLSRQFYRLRH